jgi:hypothetical protein
MKTTTLFTQPQLRALAWLPDDGSWKGPPGRAAPALDSLALYHRGLVDHEWGAFGPRGARQRRFRLTAVGIEAKKRAPQPTD